MFGLFKRKSEKEKLIELYNKKKEQALDFLEPIEKKVIDWKKKLMIFLIK